MAAVGDSDGWDDQELAELEDPATWGEDDGIVHPPSPNPRAIVSVPFALDEFALLEPAAKAAGLRLTEFIRQAALGRVTTTETNPEPTPVRRPA